uniref:Uncharacterized protein n=1 Tax=Anguilla anguilla TaxID=7936 RepID=A0A0E9SAR8_ANGAN
MACLFPPHEHFCGALLIHLRALQWM